MSSVNPHLEGSRRGCYLILKLKPAVSSKWGYRGSARMEVLNDPSFNVIQTAVLVHPFRFWTRLKKTRETCGQDAAYGRKIVKSYINRS